MRLFVVIIAFTATPAVAAPTYKHGVSFFGEFKYPPGFKHFDYVNPDAPKGGMIVLATAENWNSFTPYLNKGNVAPSIDHQYGSQPLLYDGLFTPSDDEIGTFYGNLAGEVMVADDFSWVRMRIRPEAHWHDGMPVTARDVQFTFQHIRDNSGFNLKSAFGMVESVEVHSVRAPDYWGRNLGLHRGRHNFDHIRYEFYRDATVAREAFRKGLIDYRPESDPRYWHNGYNIPARDKGWIVTRKHNFEYYVGVLQGLVV